MAKKIVKDYAKQTGDMLQSFFEGPCSAVVTVVYWTMAPNGETFTHFFCPFWKVVTDKMWPLDNFRSSEKWQLMATDGNGTVLAIFPGCQIKAVVRTNKMPNKRNVYEFKAGL